MTESDTTENCEKYGYSVTFPGKLFDHEENRPTSYSVWEYTIRMNEIFLNFPHRQIVFIEKYTPIFKILSQIRLNFQLLSLAVWLWAEELRHTSLISSNKAS